MSTTNFRLLTVAYIEGGMSNTLINLCPYYCIVYLHKSTFKNNVLCIMQYNAVYKVVRVLEKLFRSTSL